MKCDQCDNTEKFYVPVIGYEIRSYNKSGIVGNTKLFTELDTERTLKCGNCEAEWDNWEEVGKSNESKSNYWFNHRHK